jgi:hypothetical protein
MMPDDRLGGATTGPLSMRDLSTASGGSVDGLCPVVSLLRENDVVEVVGRRNLARYRTLRRGHGRRRRMHSFIQSQLCSHRETTSGGTRLSCSRTKHDPMAAPASASSDQRNNATH